VSNERDHVLIREPSRIKSSAEKLGQACSQDIVDRSRDVELIDSESPHPEAHETTIKSHGEGGDEDD
jgi:hypothetical protein